jgi:uncharacterized protein YjbI with pentapeptide repeats
MKDKDEKDKKTCRYKLNTGKSCEKPFYEGDDYCVLHSKKDKSKKSDFENAFWVEFKRQGEAGIYDFSGFIFSASISFEQVHFEKPVYFNNAIFLRDVDFRESTFHARADFSRAEFRNADFSKSTFLNEIDFKEVKFRGPVNFSCTNFSEADFRGAFFSCKSNFNGATFSSASYFSGATFSQDVDFSTASFEKGCSFIDTVFSNVDFREARLFVKSDFSKAKFLDKTDFSYAVFPGEVDFTRAEFSGETQFSKVNFLNTTGITLFDAYFGDVSGLFELLHSSKKYLKFFEKSELLFGDFRFRLGDASARRYPLIARRTKDAWYLHSFKKSYPNIYRLWKITSNCGQSFIRWMFLSLIIAAFFAALYHCIYVFYPGGPAFKGQYISSDYPFLSFFYYSIVTFTTLGFGDIIPTNVFTQLIVMLEVVLGYIMLGGLISIFANKLARRS